MSPTPSNVLLLLAWMLPMTASAQSDESSPSEETEVEAEAETGAQTPPSPPVPAPNATRACADAQKGQEVEVCLQLASEYPNQIEGISASLRAHIARGDTKDRDLMLALLDLVSDSSAPEAIERIRELSDPRLVPPLVGCAERRTPEVAESCVLALSVMPNGVTPLRTWLLDNKTDLQLREYAAESLGQMGTSEAADALVDTLRQPRVPSSLRREMLAIVQRNYADRLSDLDGQVAQDGRVWLAFGSSIGLGYAMATAGHFGQSDLTALGATTGFIGGWTAGTLYGRAFPMEAGDAAYISTTGPLGIVSGSLIAANLTQNTDTILLGGLAGGAVGYTIPALTYPQHQGSAFDSIEATGIAATAALTAEGLGQYLGSHDAIQPEARPWFPTIGLTTGTIAGQVVAPMVDLGNHDPGLIAFSTMYGYVAGQLWPYSRQRPDGMPLMLGGIGAMTGYGLAGAIEVPGDVQLASWTGAAYGGVAGLGLGMMVYPDTPEMWGGPTLVAGTAGVAAASYLTWRNPEPIDSRDVVLTGLVTGWASWQAVGWAAHFQPDTREAGAFVVAPALIGATTAVAAPYIDFPASHSLAATSLGAWGAYAGATTAELLDEPTLPWALTASNAGLATGGIVMSPLVGVSPLVVGTADAGGVLGGSTAALTASFVTDDTNDILLASLAGSVLGAAGGAIVGARWQRSGTRDVALTIPQTEGIPGNWSLTPTATYTEGIPRYGAQLAVTQW